MTDPRIRAAVDAAAKEGRILSSRGVNVEALTGVPAQAPAPQPPPPKSLAFWLDNFQKMAEACTCEAHWQRCVIDLARVCGWRIAHFRPAKVIRNGVEKYETPIAEDGKGFLDLELVRERLVKAELKFGSNKPTTEQLEWIRAYGEAGVECYIWYPSYWREVIDTLKPKEKT